MKRVNRFLLRERYEPKDLFDEVKPYINLIGGTLSGDDTVIDKPHTNPKLTELINYVWSGRHHLKFSVEKVLDDGSYLSWIHPDGKSKKKGATKMAVRVIEYTIDSGQGQQTYRLITSLLDIAVFPALLLATESHQRSRS